MNEKNELAVIDENAVNDVDKLIHDLNNEESGIYSSITGDDFGTRLAVAAAVTDSVAIADNLDKVIHMRDVIIQPVDMPDEQTGEITSVPRTIIIDADGKAYHALSKGIASGVKNVIKLVKHPSTWAEPVPIRITKEKASKGNVFVVRVVPNGK